MYQSEGQKKFINSYKKRKRLITISQIIIISIFFLSWEILAKYEVINPFIYSSPSRVFFTLKDLLFKYNLFKHIFTTLVEILIAFVIGVLGGFTIAVIFYKYPIISKIFEPFFTILNALPKVALGPIIIIIFGANTKSIIIMALLINIIVSMMTIYNGFMNVDKVKIKLFNTFNASKRQLLLKLIVPSSYNTIISSLKLTISLTLIGVITGEFLVSKMGLGYLIIYGTQVFNLNLVMASILILILLSFLLYKFITIIEKKLIKNID